MSNPSGPEGLIAVLANIPIASEPIIPAVPWTELTSSASSIFSFSLNKTNVEYDAIPIAIPQMHVQHLQILKLG